MSDNLTNDQSPALRQGAALIKNRVERLIPPPSPGRGKRSQRTLEEQMIFADAVQSFAIGQPTADLQLSIEQAFKSNDGRIFEIITEAKKHLDNLQHSKFSRTVIEARKAWIILDRQLGRDPTKAEVAAHLCEQLGDGTFYPDETTRWAEVFKAAGIASLQSAKPKRGKSRRG
jgi:hypothetical protein